MKSRIPHKVTYAAFALFVLLCFRGSVCFAAQAGARIAAFKDTAYGTRDAVNDLGASLGTALTRMRSLPPCSPMIRSAEARGCTWQRSDSTSPCQRQNGPLRDRVRVVKMDAEGRQ